MWWGHRPDTSALGRELREHSELKAGPSYTGRHYVTTAKEQINFTKKDTVTSLVPAVVITSVVIAWT